MLLFVAAVIYAGISAGMVVTIRWLGTVVPAEWLGELIKNWNLLIGSLSATAIAVWLFRVFDRKALRLPLIREWLLLPNLNGTWDVSGHTLYKDGKAASIEWPARITITQSWTKILVKLEKDGSSGSKSICAAVTFTEGDGYRLIYYYENMPDMSQRELRQHRGIVDLHFDEKKDVLKGTYFTSPERTTAGEMLLTRVKN